MATARRSWVRTSISIYPALLALCAALLLAPLAWATPPTPPPPSQAQGKSHPGTSSTALTTFRSRHYLIHTNLTREQTVPFGRHMDAVFEQYQHRFSGFVQREIEPMPLYLLRTRDEYIRFMAEHDIDATHSGGLFFVTHRLQGLATWAQSDNRPRTFRVLQHEGFHQFAWNYIGPNLPIWMNEGLAQYFEDAVLVNGRMSAGRTGRGKIGRVREAIRSGQARPLRQLNALTSPQWNQTLRDKPDEAAVLYAQAWSVVYFLIHGDDGAYQHRLIQFLQLLNQGNGEDEAFLLAFGRQGITAIQSRWARHALDQRPDDLTAATERLEFLGTGLRLLDEYGDTMPGSIGQLRDRLQAYQFSVQRSDHGFVQEFDAGDEGLFTFIRGSAVGRPYDAEFRMLSPMGRGLPPRIVAPGLSPEPTLVWHRDADGKLVQTIEYR